MSQSKLVILSARGRVNRGRRGRIQARIRTKERLAAEREAMIKEQEAAEAEVPAHKQQWQGPVRGVAGRWVPGATGPEQILDARSGGLQSRCRWERHDLGRLISQVLVVGLSPGTRHVGYDWESGAGAA